MVLQIHKIIVFKDNIIEARQKFSKFFKIFGYSYWYIIYMHAITLLYVCSN